jgi:hypothetical protein
MNDNPWVIERTITRAKEMAEEFGFRIERSYDMINVVADKKPYGKNVIIATLNDWESVELYFLGYEQAKMETNIVAILAKGKK